VQRGVTLSSTEGEFIAISQAVKEINFIHYLLNDVHVKLPMIVKANNVGYKFMSEKPATCVRTQHILALSTNLLKMALLRPNLSVSLKMIQIS
jgi:hypothetical protein